MKNIAKKRFKKYFDILFADVKKHKIYHRIRKIAPVFRIFIFVFCFFWFVIATLLVPPVPFGNFVLLLGLVILFPIDKVKSKFYYIVNKMRLKSLYTRWLAWKHTIKKKYFSTKAKYFKS